MKAATIEWKITGWPRLVTKGVGNASANRGLGIYLARDEQDNTQREAISWTRRKLNVHKRGFFLSLSFKSTILLQFISNATIYSTPRWS